MGTHICRLPNGSSGGGFTLLSLCGMVSGPFVGRAVDSSVVLELEGTGMPEIPTGLALYPCPHVALCPCPHMQGAEWSPNLGVEG